MTSLSCLEGKKTNRLLKFQPYLLNTLGAVQLKQQTIDLYSNSTKNKLQALI